MNDILKAYNIDPEKFATGVVKLLEDSLFAKKNYQTIEPKYGNGIVFDMWDYIVDNLPGYYHRDDVALSDDLQKYLDGEYNPDDPYDRRRIDEIEHAFGNSTQIAEYAAYHDAKLFVEAYEAAHNTRKDCH